MCFGIKTVLNFGLGGFKIQLGKTEKAPIKRMLTGAFFCLQFG